MAVPLQEWQMSGVQASYQPPRGFGERAPRQPEYMQSNYRPDPVPSTQNNSSRNFRRSSRERKRPLATVKKTHEVV